MAENFLNPWIVEYGYIQREKRKTWKMWLSDAGYFDGQPYGRSPIFELRPVCGEREEHINAANLIEAAPLLLHALEETLERYVMLADSGDCGNLNAEQEPHVIASRAAIKKAKGAA